LTAFALADILYDAGLPPEMLSVLTGDPAEIADELLTSKDVDLVTFTGGVPVGKHIAAKAVYKRQVLELGGNDPIIVLEDADLEEAAALAASGSYKNSGQRCTAVKRILVQESVADRFIELLVEKTRAVKYGDPFDPTMDMGTVIDEPSARRFEAVVNEAVASGARLLIGNIRRGALYRLWAVIVVVHQPPRPDHPLRAGVACRQRQRARGAGLPSGNDAIRRHQGLRLGLQGRRAGSHEELLQYQDLFAAVVT
jgi:acyl-CoA reductase-like NAD-dependent aldehyde dehydrogenase